MKVLLLNLWISVLIGPTDFTDLQTVHVGNHSAEIHLFTLHDEIALEYDDTIILRFTPDNNTFISDVENAGQFIRDTAIVNIIDNDSKLLKYSNIEQLDLYHVDLYKSNDNKI